LNRSTTDEENNAGLKEHTLKVAGYSYLGGDGAMFGAGYARGNPATVGGALSWLAGGLFAARYGNPDKQKQLRIEATKLEHHLARQGIVVPDDVRGQSALLAKKSTWEKIEQFLYQHPSEMLNGMYGVGAGMLLHDGIKELRSGAKRLVPEAYTLEKLQTVSSNFWIGALVMAGALSGILIKEDPDARKKAEHGNIFQKLWARAQQNPLGLSAGFYTANNGFLGLQFYQDWAARHTLYTNKSVKPHYFSGAQLCAYLFANSMLMMSSRNQVSKSGFNSEQLGELEEAAARIIIVQQPEIQQEVLKNIAHYMAGEKGINLDEATIAQHLTERLAVLTQAPRLAPVVHIGQPEHQGVITPAASLVRA
jgi:hypothetical protein